MEREKKIIKIGEEIDVDVDYFEHTEIDNLVKIKDVSKWIEGFKNKGATHLIFRSGCGYKGIAEGVYLQGAKIELESDELFNYRVEQEKEREVDASKDRKAQYLKLKAEFGE